MADCSYSDDLVHALLRARVIAPAWGADELRPEHLLPGLFPDNDLLDGDGYSLEVLLGLPSSFPERLKAGLLNSFPLPYRNRLCTELSHWIRAPRHW